MARKGFNPNWIKVNDWQAITGTPADASDKTKRLLSIARKADGVRVFGSPRFPLMLRIRYRDPAFALMTIRSFTRQEPTVTITPRLQGKAFKDVFPEANPNA